MLSVLCQTNIKGNMVRKRMLNLSSTDWRSLDRTYEIKHAESNLMLMENGLLSLKSSIQGILYLIMIEIRSEFHIMLLPFSKKIIKANKCTYMHSHQTIPTLRKLQLLSKIFIDSDFCHNYLHTLNLFESL